VTVYRIMRRRRSSSGDRGRVVIDCCFIVPIVSSGDHTR
jgi:hypothetical protein